MSLDTMCPLFLTYSIYHKKKHIECTNLYLCQSAVKFSKKIFCRDNSLSILCLVYYVQRVCWMDLTGLCCGLPDLALHLVDLNFSKTASSFRQTKQDNYYMELCTWARAKLMSTLLYKV